MQKQIERQILLFTEATGVTKRAEVVHGTLFVKFKNPEDKSWFRKSLKNFCKIFINRDTGCLLYTSPSPRDRQKSRMPSSA